MYIGGVKDIKTIQSRPGQVNSHDFIGCIREFKVNNVDHLTQPSNSHENILDKCPSSIGHCSGDRCNNGGRCVEEWDGFSCHCIGGFSGVSCEIGKQHCINFTLEIGSSENREDEKFISNGYENCFQYPCGSKPWHICH